MKIKTTILNGKNIFIHTILYSLINFTFSRQALMCQIIRKMQQDLHPPTMPSKPSHRFVNYFLSIAAPKL